MNARQPNVLTCTCAATPPTIPVYRDVHDHLPGCAAYAGPHPEPEPLVLGSDAAEYFGRRLVERGEATPTLEWAREVLADPVRASIEMSGMSQEDLDALRAEFGTQTRAERLREEHDRVSVALNGVEDGTLPWIERQASFTARQLADEFGFSLSNANNRVTAFRRAGLVERIPEHLSGRTRVYRRKFAR